MKIKMILSLPIRLHKARCKDDIHSSSDLSVAIENSWKKSCTVYKQPGLKLQPSSYGQLHAIMINWSHCRSCVYRLQSLSIVELWKFDDDHKYTACNATLQLLLGMQLLSQRSERHNFCNKCIGWQPSGGQMCLGSSEKILIGLE